MAESPKHSAAEPLPSVSETPAPAAPPPAQAAPPSAPKAKAPSPAAEETVELKRSFLSKLNPMMWFRKETPALWVKEGERLLMSGNRNQALVAFHKALALDPNCADGHRGLGRVTLGKGGRANAQAALAYFKEAERLNPYDSRIYQALAIAYEKLGKSTLSLASRKKLGVIKALQANPSDSVSNNNMGVLCAQLGDLDKAAESFKKAIETNGKYAPALHNLATTCFRMASTEQDAGKRGSLLADAATTIEQAVGLNAVVPNFLAQARILIAKDEALRALESIAKAEALDASNPSVYQIKREGMEKLGRMTEAQHAHEAYEACLRLGRHGAA